jgi:hypothetical protein
MSVFINPVAVDSAVVTALDALGAATFDSIPGTGPIKPSLMDFVGWQIIVAADNGYGGVGNGDWRAKWRMIATTGTGTDVRFSIPGRNEVTQSLVLPGTRTLANIGNPTWQAWVTAMGDSHLLAPQTELGLTTVIQGGTARSKSARQPRESVS